MIRLILIISLLIVSTSFAADSKKSKTISLEKKWDKDSSLIKLSSNDDFILYGVKGTVRPFANDNDIKTAWFSRLFTLQKRNEFRGEVKGTYYTKDKWGFNCINNNITIIASNYYNLKGNVIKSYSADGQWDEAIPGSVELVDGDLLVSMFETVQLGVKPKTVYEVDQAFFDQFRNA